MSGGKRIGHKCGPGLETEMFFHPCYCIWQLPASLPPSNEKPLAEALNSKKNYAGK